MASAKYSRYYTYIKPVIENPLVRSYLPYIFSLLSITIFLLFAIRPTASTILNLQKSLEKNQQVYDELNQKSILLSQGKQNLQQIEGRTRSKINLSVPTQTNITTIIATLQNASKNLASGSALTMPPVTIFDSSKLTPSNPTLAEVSFSYTVSGSFNQLLQTLENIRTGPRLINIDNLSLNKQADGSILMVMSGKAFYLK